MPRNRIERVRTPGRTIANKQAVYYWTVAFFMVNEEIRTPSRAVWNESWNPPAS
jgi:hypothetical protein